MSFRFSIRLLVTDLRLRKVVVVAVGVVVEGKATLVADRAKAADFVAVEEAGISEAVGGAEVRTFEVVAAAVEADSEEVVEAPLPAKPSPVLP